jgi:hypothetical protein
VGGVVGDSSKRVTELLAPADVELREDLAQVVLDGAWADEELGADLRVRLSVARHAGDLCLLRSENVEGVRGAPGHVFSGGRQFATGALGERFGAEPMRLRPSWAA